MEYKYEYICKMKQPVLCELCNKSYTIGVLKKHKQTNKDVDWECQDHGVPSYLWFVGGHKPNAFPSATHPPIDDSDTVECLTL